MPSACFEDDKTSQSVKSENTFGIRKYTIFKIILFCFDVHTWKVYFNHDFSFLQGLLLQITINPTYPLFPTLSSFKRIK